jgi:hypothetical protein
MLLIRDTCHVNRACCSMCLKGAQMVALQHVAYLYLKRFPTLVLKSISKNTSVFVLWLKCRNLERVSGEQQKLRSTAQGGRVLKKYRVKHPLHKTSKYSHSNKTFFDLFGQVGQAENGLPIISIDDPFRIFKPNNKAMKCRVKAFTICSEIMGKRPQFKYEQ